MKLYGASQSPFVRKAHIVLEEKGIPYETENLIPVLKTPELLALHPMGKIPVLRDGEVVVPDSSVICAYLEKKALGAQLGTLTLAGIEIDVRRWPRTASYYRALLARPSFKTAMAQ